MHICYFALLLLFLTFPAIGQEAEVPFSLPMPDGWRGETIAFPLAFAPELAYEGLEELRFSPGMFKPESEDFWTYAFVWWVPLSTSLDAATLGSDLEVYFRGLSKSVNASQDFDPGEMEFRASLAAEGDGEQFAGQVVTFDAFATRGPITLNVRIEVWRCEAAERLVVFFELSPQAKSHAVWQTLAGIREGFRCAL